MKILRFSAENFKRIKLVEITPDGNLVVLTGKNGAGKTSVLDALLAAICGARGLPDVPIREGAEAATITVDLGDYTIERKFGTNKNTGAGTTTLVVKTADGVSIKSPQQLLDRLVGDFSFDPSEFLKAKNQAEILLRLAKFAFDPEAWKAASGVKAVVESQVMADPLKYIDGVRANRYEQRTDINRQIKDIDGAIKTTLAGVPEEQRGLEPLDIGELLDAHAAARAAHEKAARAKQAACALAADLDKKIVELHELEQRIAALKDVITGQRLALENAEAEAERLYNAAPDLSGLDAQIKNAESHNQVARIMQGVREREAMLAELKEESGKLTDSLAAIDKFKLDLLAGAGLPVPGLGIDGDVVTFEGIPMAQCSHAQKLRISMAVGMAANPALRVLRITDGEKFDGDSWAQIGEFSATNDIQAWIECMNESGEIGIYIEDGQVAAVNTK